MKLMPVIATNAIDYIPYRLKEKTVVFLFGINEKF